MTNLADEFGNLFDMLDEPTNPLARLAWLEGLPVFGDVPAYQLFDVGGVSFTCQYCGRNRWVSTGDEFVCDHSHDEEYEYCPLPVYDAVDFGDVDMIVRLDNG